MRSIRNSAIAAAAFFMLFGGLVVTTEAQTRRSVQRPTRRPVVVRRVYYRDPFWRSRWGRSWGWGSRWRSPYMQYQDERQRHRNDLAGNRRELDEHLRKYKADGVITAKEQRELDDDYKDVRNSELRLREFDRQYSTNY